MNIEEKFAPLTEYGIPSFEDYDLKQGSSLDEKKGRLKITPKNKNTGPSKDDPQIERKIILVMNVGRDEIYRSNGGGKRFICSFDRKGGINKRFDYVKKIFTAESVPAKDLNKKGNFQNISSEIKEINRRLIRDLNLAGGDPIINPGGGYQKNIDAYGFKIE